MRGGGCDDHILSDGRLHLSPFPPAPKEQVRSISTLVSGCGGGPLASDRVFSGNVFSSNHLKPKDYPIHGIDVSKFQGDIDWNAVAYSGVKFAWIKAIEGGDRADARFQANWEG